MQRHIAYISVGSNIGDKLENCRKGIAALTGTGAFFLREQSRFYTTEPVNCREQDWFVNAVIKIETDLDPFQLLNELKAVQRDMGRAHDTVRFGPRILDLDIILYDDAVIDSPQLVVPHPRMHKRRFVLRPICDIDPTIIHPVFKQNVQYLLDRLNENGQEVCEHTCDY